MPETSANEANYEEIRGHLDIIKAKLAKPADPDTRASLSEDLEDYYERALQLRIMQNNTQSIELDEQTARFQWLAWYARRGGVMLAIACVAATVMAVELVQPGSIQNVTASPTAHAVGSHTAVAVVVVVATILCTRA